MNLKNREEGGTGQKERNTRKEEMKGDGRWDVKESWRCTSRADREERGKSFEESTWRGCLIML